MVLSCILIFPKEGNQSWLCCIGKESCVANQTLVSHLIRDDTNTSNAHRKLVPLFSQNFWMYKRENSISVVLYLIIGSKILGTKSNAKLKSFIITQVASFEIHDKLFEVTTKVYKKNDCSLKLFSTKKSVYFSLVSKFLTSGLSLVLNSNTFCQKGP